MVALVMGFQFFATARGKNKWLSALPSLIEIAGVIFSIAGIIVGGLAELWDIWLFCLAFWMVYYIGIGIAVWYGKREKRILSRYEETGLEWEKTPPFEKEKVEKRKER